MTHTFIGIFSNGYLCSSLIKTIFNQLFKKCYPFLFFFSRKLFSKLFNSSCSKQGLLNLAILLSIFDRLLFAHDFSNVLFYFGGGKSFTYCV